MAPLNRLAKVIGKVKGTLPESLHPAGLSLAFNSQIKLAGTAGIKIEDVTHDKAVVSLKNRRRVQNHIGTIHACGMALLAESASGIVFGMNVPDTHIPVIKTMQVDFKKMAKGNMKAVANLTPEQIQQITSTEKGSTVVNTVVTDETGAEPIQVRMEWAWTPKRR